MNDQPVILPLPLAELPPGASARLVAIQGGRELGRRLLGLGLRVGNELRIEHRRGRGRGLVIATGETRIALGGGIVDKLLVSPLPGVPAATDGIQVRTAAMCPPPAHEGGFAGLESR